MKKFFYACAAILCLVLAYHFGATNAQGQSGTSFQVIGSEPFVNVGGVVYALDPFGSRWKPVSSSDLPPVPPSEIIYFYAGNAITASGEGWTTQNGDGWRSIGFIPGGPTPAVQSSWGAVKARYR